MKVLQRWTSLTREAVVPMDTDFRDRFAFLLLLAFILVAPWLGGAHLPDWIAGTPAPMGRLIIPAFGFAIGAVAFSSRSSFRSLRPLALPLAAILGLTILGVLQLVPLPDAALAQIAPVNLQIYHETAELLGLYGASAPAARLSLATDETAATVLRLGGYAILAAATAHLLRTRPRRRFFIGTLIAAVCLQVLAAGLLLVSGRPFRGAFPTPDDFSDYLLVLLPVGFCALWAEVLTNADRGRGTADRGDRLAQRLSPLVLRILACATIAAGMALTGSPVNLLAGAAAMLLLLLLAARRPPDVRRAVAAAVIAFVAPLVLVARAHALPMTSLSADLASGRSLAIWRGCLDTWRSFPIFGSGLGAFRDAFRRIQPSDLTGLVDTAQSDPLQILVTGGAVGALFVVVGFVALLVLLLRRWKTQRHREERALTLAGVGALLAIALDGLVEFNLGAAAVPATAACVIGLALAAGDGSPREQPPAPRTQ